jgi:CubicO group peptidase (beta-lactamase class C family)
MRENATNQVIGPCPGKTWLQYESPEDAGYSPCLLEEVRDAFKRTGLSALLVIHNGAILLAEGQVNRRFECRSIRKSFLSALYGIYASKGILDLDDTMADLMIDDEPPLTPGEKQARVRHLLQARSGVYHLAAFEVPREKPPRDSSKPGERWYYNNWDFNTLLTIFEQQTGTCFFEEFKRQIADPLQMEEFRLRDTFYHFEKDRSIHPAYLFRMSAKDMARFGLLYLRRGRWQDRQIIPSSWVTESTTSYSNPGEDGYGYMWWVYDVHMPDWLRRFHELGVYEASGTGGQKITVVPQACLVIVHLRNTYVSADYDPKQLWALQGMIFNARRSMPIANPRLIPFQDPPRGFESVPLETTVLDKYVGDYEFENGVAMVVKRVDNSLVLENMPVWPHDPPTLLLPISENKFILEDVGHTVTFDVDDSDYQVSIQVTADRTSYGKRACSTKPTHSV